MNERIEALRQKMREGGIDAALVTLPINRRYLTGYTATDSTSGSSAGWLLVTADRALLLVGFLGLEQAHKECPGVEIQQFVGSPTALAVQIVKDSGVRRLAFEGNHLTYLNYAELAKLLGDGITLVPVDGWVEGLRATKDEGEIAKTRQAASITDAAFLRVLDVLKPGVTERELAWEAESYMREHGAEGLAFDVAVASGPNTSLPHNDPSDRAITPGEPIWIDMGARFEGYCADLTRSFCLGRPEQRLREVWDLVLLAQETAIKRCREGMTGKEADSLARDIIATAGHGADFGHSLGHGVGLVVHEHPRLSQLSPDTLGPNMVVTFEPGIYVAGWGGVRIEDLGVVREGGVELLSAAPKMLSVG
ncbi:MAG: M24 family metallopeptidase [Chloroflexota bacterium]